MSENTTSSLTGHLLEFHNVARNYTSEEQAIVVKLLPTQLLQYELARRDEKYSEIYNNVINLINSTDVEALESVEALIKALRQTLKMR